MNIRKFEANSFEEALGRIKAELGPDALILASEEKKRGWFQKPIVEITAAFDGTRNLDETVLEQVFPHRRKKDSPMVLLPQEGHGVSRSGGAVQVPPSTVAIEKGFLGLGLSAEVAKDFARRVVLEFPKSDRETPGFLDQVQLKWLAQGVKTLGPDVFKTRRSWAAVGSPGVGKTSLLVKLALFLKAQGRRVKLTSCDNRKVTSRHELAAYARLLRLPYEGGDVETRANQWTLMDTPSLGLESDENFKTVERRSRDASTVLVLDASHRLCELLRVVDRFSSLAPVAVAFTRLDLVSQSGVVYDVLHQTKLPLLGFSVSHSLTTPFRFFEPTSLARYLVKQSLKGEA